MLGTLNVVRGCLDSAGRLRQRELMTVYGEPELVPTPEEGSMHPGFLLRGQPVRAAERYVQITGERNDVELNVTSLRMFNVYGERQSIDNPYQGVLAIFIGNALRGEPITIHGDGLQTRDFVYIGDVVDAWMRVLDMPETFGAVLNVGSGRGTSVNELADAVVAGVRRVSRELGHRLGAGTARGPASFGGRHHTDLRTRLGAADGSRGRIARTVASGARPARLAKSSSSPGSR